MGLPVARELKLDHPWGSFQSKLFYDSVIIWSLNEFVLQQSFLAVKVAWIRIVAGKY